ncbi:MAG: hypothetical protein IJ360_02335 [Clostridia bacterium]|nr:hypothetical protein [Clostridia bacterium]
MISRRIINFLSLTVSILVLLTAIYSNIVEILTVDALATGEIFESVPSKPEISAPYIDFTQTATITYNNLGFDVNLEDCTYQSENLNIISAYVVEDALEFEVSATNTEGFGKLDIEIVSGDDIIKDTVHTYNNGYNIYFDKISKYQAWYNAMLYVYNQNTDDNIIISEGELNNRYSAFTSPLFEGTPMIESSNNSNVLFTGNVVWETNDTPDSNRPVLPMRNALIEIGTKTLGIFTAITSGHTGTSGEYSISLSNDKIPEDKDLYFRISLEGKTFEVKVFWFFPHYYYESNLGKISNGDIVTFNPRIKCDNNEDIYKATYVHQAMVIAERFAESMGFKSENMIRVAYPAESITIEINGIPYSLSDMAFCYGDFWGNCIAAIGVNSYNNTQMIVHEYSLYIQCALGNFGEGLPEVIFMSNHDGDSDYLTIKKDKSFAMHLAWAEGWGYAFSVMAQKYYRNEYSGMKNYDTTQTLINTYNHDDFYGEFQEKTVKAFLWELLDQSKIVYNRDAPVEELDYQLPWTPQEWWNMTTVPGTCRFPDFMRLIEEEGYDESMDIDYKALREDIAYYLTKYDIAPEIKNITYTSGTLNISVRVNGSTTYPNNCLVVKVFDENNNLLATSNEKYPNVGRHASYDILELDDLWSEVLSKCSCTDGQTTNLKISVVGYREDTTDPDGTAIESQFRKTGPYYSEYEELPITHEHTYSSVNAATHNRYCSGCGTTTVQPHRFVYAKFNDAMHSARCADCGYFQFMSHNMVYEQVDGRYHEHHCSYCSHSEGNSLHVLKSNGSTNRYQNCTACGALVDTGINMFPTIKNKIEEEEYTE